jgi:hypothetical protein
MQHELSQSDRSFLAEFESCALRPAEFHHREHIRVGYAYLVLYPFDLALEKMRRGLHNLLAHFGAPSSKYHETVTRAWLLAVQHFMDMIAPSSSFDQFIQQGGARLLEKEIMATHYSAAMIGSEEARQRFVAPDFMPFPHEVAT